MFFSPSQCDLLLRVSSTKKTGTRNRNSGFRLFASFRNQNMVPERAGTFRKLRRKFWLRAIYRNRNIPVSPETDFTIATKEIEKQFPFQQLPQQRDKKADDDNASAIKPCFDCVKYPWNPIDENPHDPNSSIAQFHSLCDYMDLHDDNRAFIYFKCKKHFDSAFPDRAWNKAYRVGQTRAIMKRATAITNRRCPNSLSTHDDEKQATLEFHQQCPYQIPGSNSDDDDSSLDEEARSYFNKKPAAVNTSEEITILESTVPAVEQAKLKPVPSSIPEKDLIPLHSPRREYNRRLRLYRSLATPETTYTDELIRPYLHGLDTIFPKSLNAKKKMMMPTLFPILLSIPLMTIPRQLHRHQKGRADVPKKKIPHRPFLPRQQINRGRPRKNSSTTIASPPEKKARGRPRNADSSPSTASLPQKRSPGRPPPKANQRRVQWADHRKFHHHDPKKLQPNPLYQNLYPKQK
jgi:hypothetical protein